MIRNLRCGTLLDWQRPSKPYFVAAARDSSTKKSLIVKRKAIIDLFFGSGGLILAPNACRLSDFLTLNRATVRAWPEFALIFKPEA
jgi:hypothetical protein